AQERIWTVAEAADTRRSFAAPARACNLGPAVTPSFEIRTPRLVLAPGGAGDQAPIDAMLRDPRVAQPFSLRLASGGGEPRAATGTWLQALEDWERLRRLTLVIRLDPAGDVIG